MDNHAVKNVFKSGDDRELLRKLLLEKWIYFIKYMAGNNER